MGTGDNIPHEEDCACSTTRVQSRFFQQNCVVGVEDEILMGICIRGGRIGDISSRI
jgi:hypothetical protein